MRSKLVTSYTKAISVSQKAFVFDSTPVSFSIGALETDQKSVKFDHTGNGSITITGDRNWVTETVAAGTAANPTFTYRFIP